MNKKSAIIYCVIGAGGLTYGGMNFELGGIDSTTTAITVSISIVIGAVVFIYGIYALFQDKTKTSQLRETTTSVTQCLQLPVTAERISRRRTQSQSS